MNFLNDLSQRLKTRALIRRNIKTRKSVQEGQPDRIADLLEEAAAAVDAFADLKEQHNQFRESSYAMVLIAFILGVVVGKLL